MASSSAPPAVDPREESPAEQTQTTTEKSTAETANTNPPSTSADPKPSQAQKQPSPAGAQDDDDDDDSDFDELDDVLDNFKPTPATTAPKNPAATPAPTSAGAAGALPNSDPDFDEEAFMKQLERDMASMLGQGSGPPGGDPVPAPAHLADIEQGADAFTKQLEESGIPPGDFIKQLLADVMAEEGAGAGADPGASAAAATAAGTSAAAAAGAAGAAASATAGGDKKGGAPGTESFNDAIHRTINRMKESGDKATAAASGEDDLSDDVLAQFLQALEAGQFRNEKGEDYGDMMTMVTGIMEELSNKQMLYEPMQELDTKFGPWIAANKDKVTGEDLARYEKQAGIVREIVAKFEEPGYTDEDAKCREYVWERMQAMQAAGNPPEDLIANPFDESGAGPNCAPQ